MTLKELQNEIGEWSWENFGHNLSKVPDCSIVLGHVAPVLGLMEEAAELANAKNDNEGKDAIGDIGIYFADFCSRSGLDLQELVEDVQEQELNQWQPIGPAIGQLAHVVLKRHQGIRGMLDDAEYEKALRLRAVGVAKAWLMAGTLRGYDSATLTKSTWTKIVSKRNWKRNAADGKVTSEQLKAAGSTPEASKAVNREGGGRSA